MKPAAKGWLAALAVVGGGVAAWALTRRSCRSVATSTWEDGVEAIEVREACRTPVQRVVAWARGAAGWGGIYDAASSPGPITLPSEVDPDRTAFADPGPYDRD